MAEKTLTTTLFGWMSDKDKNPLTARARFRHRQLRYWGKAGVIFAGIAFGLAIFIPWVGFVWLGDIAAGIVVWHLLVKVWEKDPVMIRCPHCSKLIRTNTPWVCGVKKCKFVNLKTDKFPFVDECEDCRTEQKAYRCHHTACLKTIFLTEDEDDQIVACAVNSKSETENPPPSPALDEAAERDQKRKAREHDILMAKLDADYAKATAHLKRIKDGDKSIEEQYLDAKNRDIKLKDIYHREKKAFEEEHRDNPQALEEKLLWLEEWKNKMSV